MTNVGTQRGGCGDATRFVRGHAVRAGTQRGACGDAIRWVRGRNAVRAGDATRCVRGRNAVRSRVWEVREASRVLVEE